MLKIIGIHLIGTISKIVSDRCFTFLISGLCFFIVQDQCSGSPFTLSDKTGDTVRSANLKIYPSVQGNTAYQRSLFKAESVESRLKSLDDFARQAPAAWEKSVKMLADSLTKPARNDREKVRILFAWVATHVKYNAGASQRSSYHENSSLTTIRLKQGLCGDFSRLLSDLCKTAGIEAYRLSGYTKGFRFLQHFQSQPSRHAWNVIRIDGRWSLSDVTWASSILSGSENNIICVPRFEPFWFDVDPRAFIFTHYPDSDKWQLLGNERITYNQFIKFPYLGCEFFKVGFDVNQAFRIAFSQKNEGFVLVYNQRHTVDVVKAPVSRSVKRYSRLNFIIRSGFAESIVLWDDRKPNFFTNDRNTFSLDWIPTGKTIRVSVKDKDSQTYKRLLEYDIKP